MKSINKRYIGLLGLLLLMSCQGKQEPYKVSYQVYGKLMEIMQQNKLQARVKLRDLTFDANSYGLGAMEGLKGEILISGGKVITSIANPDSILMESSNNVSAALLVTTEVAEWNTLNMNSSETMKGLEALIESKASEFNLDTNDVIPFKIEASPKQLNWHIINASLAKEQNHQAYKESGKTGVLENESVEIIGFFSKSHQGVFTHHGSFLHLHFISANGELMGHVDDLELSGNWKLELPKAEKP